MSDTQVQPADIELAQIEFMTRLENLFALKTFLENLSWCKRHGQPATHARPDRCKVHLFAMIPECEVVRVGVWEIHGN